MLPSESEEQFNAKASLAAVSQISIRTTESCVIKQKLDGLQRHLTVRRISHRTARARLCPKEKFERGGE
jgi:hypothetical protein